MCLGSASGEVHHVMSTLHPQPIRLLAAACLAFGLASLSCHSGDDPPRPAAPKRSAAAIERATPPSAPPGPAGRNSATVAIDGSSTVFPITEAVANAFEQRHPGISIQLGVSGTGGGFRKFCAGETAIQNASRPIKSSEAEICAAAGIAFVELPVAYDGLTFVVHGANTWATCLSLDELRRLWEPAAEGRIESWSDLRPGWPARRLHLYGAGRDSGTFDYMTSALLGREGEARRDYIGSEDDYLLAQKVAADPDGLGFFGFAYFREYQSRLRAVAIDAGAGCVAPDESSIVAGVYRPLSRPIFIYVSLPALEREEVRTFASFYLEAAPRLVPAARCVALPARAYTLAQERLAKRIPGSLFAGGGSQVGVSVESLLEMETSSLAARP